MKKISLEAAQLLGVPFKINHAAYITVFRYVWTDEGLVLDYRNFDKEWERSALDYDVLEFAARKYGLVLWEKDQS